MRPLLTLQQVLLKHKIVTTELAEKVKAFIQANQTKDPTADATAAVNMAKDVAKPKR